ncbi:MAG TPA: DUF4402 domain-containing protein [Sphingomicrobium sp.]|nr:DUF4402 domain-containing protein [Sphingomicrobium sp.]
MRIKSLVLAAGMAAAALGASPASAVTPPTQAQGHALLLIPLTLTKIQDLDFGSVVPSAVSGAVTINAATGARTFAGGVTGVPSEVGNRAYFAGAGSPSQQVILVLIPPAQLTSTAGDTIPLLGLTMDGFPIRTIDPTHAFYVGVGGSIQVAANQPEGDYSADFTLTAVYQ